MSDESPGWAAIGLALALAGLACRPEAGVELAAPPSTIEPPALHATVTDATTDAAPAPAQAPGLPAVPDPPPPPTTAPPPETPGAEGSITHLVAIDDERAVVVFSVPQWDGEREDHLALMHRDGSIAWVRPLPQRPEDDVVLLGDTIVVKLLDPRVEAPPKITVHGFSLSTGTPRWSAELGTGTSQGSLADGVHRYDLLPAVNRDHREVVKVVASTAKGVAWRAALFDIAHARGAEPMVLGEVLAVRTRAFAGIEHAEWVLVDRRSGEYHGSFASRSNGCSDGTRWFVVTDEGLSAVDVRRALPRPVTGALVLPRSTGSWTIEDCTLVSGAPVVLAAQRERRALVALDDGGATVREHVELDAATREALAAAPDPLPPVSHPAMALPTKTGDGVQGLHLVSTDVRRPIERWSAMHPPDHWSLRLVQWSGGYLFGTHHLIVTIDGRTGALEGRAVVPEGTWPPDPEQRVGHTLWLPPTAPFVLGKAAPRLVDLRAEVPDDVRAAAVFDLRVEVGRGT